MKFIEKVRKVHGDKYDYSKVKYVNAKTKVCIICPEHGEFWQTPNSHLSGHSCPQCGFEKRRKNYKEVNNEWIKKVKEVHGDKYDYSKVEYKGAHTKVCIICPIHGEFWQTSNNHLKSYGCPKCKNTYLNSLFKIDKKQFIEKARKVHGDKYDYSKVTYINNHTKICIICPIHGEFWQTPGHHLMDKKCSKCSKVYRYTTEEWIEEMKKIHNNKYDYSKVNYVNAKTKVCIICPIHGEFWQTPDKHKRGDKCPKCKGLYKTTKEWIIQAKEVHGDKYDYSKSNYLNTNTKISIICPEHGKFWQLPGSHLNKSGCPKCKQSHLEKEITFFLDSNKIKYTIEKKFNWLRYVKNKYLSLDFYLPDFNIAIECQGEQHFKPVDFANKGKEWAKKIFRENKKRDEIKYKLCKEHNIPILYYTKDFFKYNNLYNSNNTFTNFDELLNVISTPEKD